MNIKKSIIIVAVVAVATSIGVYANGAYAQSAYANNDGDTTQVPKVEIAKGSLGCWICNEDPTIIDNLQSEFAIISDDCPAGFVCNAPEDTQISGTQEPDDGGAIVE